MLANPEVGGEHFVPANLVKLAAHLTAVRRTAEWFLFRSDFQTCASPNSHHARKAAIPI